MTADMTLIMTATFGEVRRTGFIVLIVIEFCSRTFEVQVERNTGHSRHPLMLLVSSLLNKAWSRSFRISFL